MTYQAVSQSVTCWIDNLRMYSCHYSLEYISGMISYVIWLLFCFYCVRIHFVGPSFPP